MAQLITVRLSRTDAQPWGLRLQGGKDFGTPLLVQKVNMGSIADQAGLIAGDSLIKVNNTDVFSLRHKDAQDVIVRSGNSFEVVVQRGGSTWKPSVTPNNASVPTPIYGNHITTHTKTSLAHQQQDVKHIGSGYNNAARPFQNGSGDPVKSIVNKQYNTPVGIYSEESIAETLSAQAEVLAGGVLGVNFKKNEKVYNSAGSEVLKALQEAENDPAEPEDYHDYPTHRAVTPVTKHVIAPVDRPAPPQTAGLPAGQNICAECERLIVHAVGGAASASRSHTPNPNSGEQQQQQQRTATPLAIPAAKFNQQPRTATPTQQLQNQPQGIPASKFNQPPAPVVAAPAAVAPVAQQQQQLPQQPPQISSSDTAKVPPCDECGAAIVGVFVRIKDKNLHVDCFKCATCGTSLKNQGYFNLNNKLYCDIHAKMAALQNPPAGTEGYKPVPILPNTKLSASTISAALNAHHLPNQNGTSAPPSHNLHDILLPSHSRQSSTNSSLGSSYMSSLDSNKASTSKTSSPVHSRQGSNSLQEENDKNMINSSYLNNNQNSSTLPRYQSKLNAHIREIYHEMHKPSLLSSSIFDDDEPDNKNKFENGKEESDAMMACMPASPPPPPPPPPESAEVIYGTIRSPQKTNDSPEEFNFKTLNGNVIRKVHAPGTKGPVNNNVYKINSSIAGPKPFSYGAVPPQAGPKSPSSFPPPNLTPSWVQQTKQPAQNYAQPPKQTYAPPQQTYAPPQQTYAPPQQTYAPPQQTYAPPPQQQQQVYSAPSNNYGSNTLPRPAAHNAPGRYNSLKKPGYNNNYHSHNQVPPPLPTTQPPNHQFKVDTNVENKPAPLNGGGSAYYKPGHATEMLEKSISNLKVSEKDNFRSNAGKIISFMLETRLNDKSLPVAEVNGNNSDKNATYPNNIRNKSPILLKSNSYDNDLPVVSAAYQQQLSPQSLTSSPQRSPVRSPVQFDAQRNLSANLFKTNMSDRNTDSPRIHYNNYNGTGPTSLSPVMMKLHLSEVPEEYPNYPPPPQSPLHHFNGNGRHSVESPTSLNYSQNDNKITVSIHNNSPAPAAAPDNRGEQNRFLRQNSELTSHAHDRRSFIEPHNLATNPNTNNNNHNVNRVSNTQTIDIASELRDGNHPVCSYCNIKITRGPFITALGRIWCPDHFVCVSQDCRRPLQDIGFVEEKGQLYCEYCFEKYLAPPCDKCGAKIKGDCLNAIGKHFHPECFTCSYCGKLFGNSPFFLEEGQAYCETDWNEMFTTKCFACGFPVEAGDRWVEALSHNYHSQCFNCTTCKKNLEGQSFFAKGGRPYCKAHAR